jgi:hypothetical protein
VAYHNFYLKSREFEIPPQQQDIVLETTLDSILDGLLKKISKEKDYSEEKSKMLIEEVKKLTVKWKIELDQDYYSKDSKLRILKYHWWVFWGKI